MNEVYKDLHRETQFSTLHTSEEDPLIELVKEVYYEGILAGYEHAINLLVRMSETPHFGVLQKFEESDAMEAIKKRIAGIRELEAKEQQNHK